MVPPPRRRRQKSLCGGLSSPPPSAPFPALELSRPTRYGLALGGVQGSGKVGLPAFDLAITGKPRKQRQAYSARSEVACPVGILAGCASARAVGDSSAATAAASSPSSARTAIAGTATAAASAPSRAALSRCVEPIDATSALPEDDATIAVARRSTACALQLEPPRRPAASPSPRLHHLRTPRRHCRSRRRSRPHRKLRPLRTHLP